MKKRAKTGSKTKGGGRLSANQIKAAGMIANGLKLIVVAERCDVDDSTLRRWRDSQLFMAKIRDFQRVQEFEIRHELKVTAVELTRNLRAAIATAAAVMNDDDAKPGDKLAAARLAADMAYRLLPSIESISTPTPGEANEADFDEAKLKQVRERVYGIYD